jgi:hypothetical protein
MGRKVFVSYKYGDSDVHPLTWVNARQGLTLQGGYQQTTVRHYVDELQGLLAADDHINKGECDGEDLSHFKDSTIESRLRAKIHDSSTTIVMISPNMKEYYTQESDQWIPWEISYSLKEHTRNGRTSRSNALLAIVLPDRSNCYSYYIDNRSCCASGCHIYNTDIVFQIMARNMFNVKTPSYMACSSGRSIFQGQASYVHTVTWHDFKLNSELHLNIATEINENIYNYNLIKTVN